MAILLAWLAHLLLLCASSSCSSSALTRNDPCYNVDCGHGKCINFTAFIFIKAYACQCDSGWASPLGLISAPCVLPNCTLNENCDKNVASPMAPPPPPAPPPSIFNACSFPVCGHGSCVNQLLSYTCDCQPGYSNFLNIPSGYCMQQCQLAADCSNLGIGIGQNTSNQNQAPTTTTNTTTSQSAGFDIKRPHHGLMIVVLVIISLVLLG